MFPDVVLVLAFILVSIKVALLVLYLSKIKYNSEFIHNDILIDAT